MRRDEGMLVAALHGRIDTAQGAEEVHGVLKDALLPDDHALVLDFEAVTYLSSAGLRMVARLAHHTSISRMRFVACVQTEHIRQIFTVTGFDQIVPIVDSLAAAETMVAS